MLKIQQLLSLTFLLLLASAKVYTSLMSCGTCLLTSGCTGNMCLLLAGDITAQYCYGSATCGFSVPQNISFGTCTQDLAAQSCSSGVCMSGGSSNMCFSTYGGSCPSGTTFNETCSGTSVTASVAISGGSTVSTTVDLGISCPFTSASGSYSSCSSDAYGGSCSCCASFNVTGVSSGMGACIPASSPLLAVKSKLGGQMIALVSGTILYIILAFLF